MLHCFPKPLIRVHKSKMAYKYWYQFFNLSSYHLTKRQNSLAFKVSIRLPNAQVEHANRGNSSVL